MTAHFILFVSCIYWCKYFVRGGCCQLKESAKTLLWLSHVTITPEGAIKHQIICLLHLGFQYPPVHCQHGIVQKQQLRIDTGRQHVTKRAAFVKVEVFTNESVYNCSVADPKCWSAERRDMMLHVISNSHEISACWSSFTMLLSSWVAVVLVAGAALLEPLIASLNSDDLSASSVVSISCRCLSYSSKLHAK